MLYLEHLTYLSLQNFLYNRFTSDEQIIDIWNSTKEVVEELPTSKRKYPLSQVSILCLAAITFVLTV